MKLGPLNNNPILSLPALVGRAGERTAYRFAEFFTVHIRNANTQAACSHAAALFLDWCEARGIFDLGAIQPMHVAAYIEQLKQYSSAPSVQQHLTCIRTLFGWLVTGHVLPSNPAHSVRGPRHTVTKGAMPVISSAEAEELFDSIDDSTVVGLHDRALVAVMAFTFARVSAVAGLKVHDYYPQRKRRWIRWREKNGKVNQVPCHHRLETYLDVYLAASGITDDARGWLFRATIGRTGKLSNRSLSRNDVWFTVGRRAANAQLQTAIDCPTLHAAGITDHLTSSRKL